MGDKIRGAIAILVGVFALYQSFMLYQAFRRDWHLWLELGAGVVLICLGTWRIRRKPVDPLEELLK
jgi:ABC-type nickel/cobalt efflux system permease component RcnA